LLETTLQQRAAAPATTPRPASTPRPVSEEAASDKWLTRGLATLILASEAIWLSVIGYVVYLLAS
jgi:hypothetical protein